MILGIGIDSVEITRFGPWQTMGADRLSRVFSPDEIAYCTQLPAKAAERFAARFAAKEATLKALSQAFSDKTFTLMNVAKAVEIVSTSGAPTIAIDWDHLQISPDEAEPLAVLVSLTHTQTTASAIVLIQAAL